MDDVALIALGSNLGDSIATVSEAIHRLKDLSDQPLLESSLWQTSPVDCPPGSAPFVNATVALVPHTDETPETLLLKLQEMEQIFGRRPKTILNEPRPLDLDLVAFWRETRNSETLILPHPRAHQRKFVLQPLNEIVPDYVWPGTNRTVSELLQALQSQEVLTRIDR